MVVEMEADMDGVIQWFDLRPDRDGGGRGSDASERFFFPVACCCGSMGVRRNACLIVAVCVDPCVGVQVGVIGAGAAAPAAEEEERRGRRRSAEEGER